jgi:ATP-binding cassette, subfamily B, bacterial
MMPGGFGGGGFGAGGGLGASAQPGGGLPFAGIPPEYQQAIDALLRDEPTPRPLETRFDLGEPIDARPFSLATFLLPHWRKLAVAFGLIASEQLFVHSGPFLTKIAIDSGITPKDWNVLFAAVGAYLFAIAADFALGFVRISYTGRMGQGLMYALRVRVFTHLQRLGLDFYTRERAGRVMTRMTSDITALSTLFQEGVVNLVVNAVTLALVVGVLLYMNATLATILLVAVLPVMLGLTLWFRTASGRAYGAVRERIADVLADFQESLSGVRVITMHNRQLHNLIRHRNVLGRHADANVNAARIASIYGPATLGVEILGQVVIFSIGATMVADGTLQPGELAAFVLYVGTIFGPIQELVQLYNTYQSGNAAVRKLRELFATEPNVPQAPHARELPGIDGEIHFDAVTFGYDERRPVLHDLELRIHAGETFAVVGQTGAGKSTLAKLITRLYDPQGGCVRIDGHDIRNVTLASLRRQIGVVPQEPFLFAGTLRDNIAFARPEASDAEVLEVCRAVGILELVERMPKGIHTPCHERGVTLSSGERQLMALARAFLAEPRVLVLDEATSNLDLQTEALVERALDALLEGRTAVLIAHRLSTAMRADRIAVLHGGRLAELGSHDELIGFGGRYARMYDTWARQGREPNAE